jgi:hypothetical protein
MNVRYRVELRQAERHQLIAMLNGGRHAARKLKRAQILLAAEAGRSDEEIACVERGAAARGVAQAHGEAGGAVGGDRLHRPSARARPLDAAALGRRHGQAHRAPEPVI